MLLLRYYNVSILDVHEELTAISSTAPVPTGTRMGLLYIPIDQHYIGERIIYPSATKLGYTLGTL